MLLVLVRKSDQIVRGDPFWGVQNYRRHGTVHRVYGTRTFRRPFHGRRHRTLENARMMRSRR
eukprot:scaffold47193_cov58-Attheya_sp.AAC.6